MTYTTIKEENIIALPNGKKRKREFIYIEDLDTYVIKLLTIVGGPYDGQFFYDSEDYAIGSLILISDKYKGYYSKSRDERNRHNGGTVAEWTFYSE